MCLWGLQSASRNPKTHFPPEPKLVKQYLSLNPKMYTHPLNPKPSLRCTRQNPSYQLGYKHGLGFRAYKHQENL